MVTSNAAGTSDATASVTDENRSGDAVAANTGDEDEAQSVKPLPLPSDDEGETDKWLWVGAGSAAVLLTGLVVGGIVVMSDSGSDGTGSFDAQLTW